MLTMRSGADGLQTMCGWCVLVRTTYAHVQMTHGWRARDARCSEIGQLRQEQLCIKPKWLPCCHRAWNLGTVYSAGKSSRVRNIINFLEFRIFSSPMQVFIKMDSRIIRIINQSRNMQALYGLPGCLPIMKIKQYMNIQVLTLKLKSRHGKSVLWSAHLCIYLEVNLYASCYYSSEIARDLAIRD